MKKYLSIAFLSIAFLGMSTNAQNLQDFIDYIESDNQLASEACLKQPVDNAVYDITLTHGDGSKNVLYCMNRTIFKDKTEAHCLAYEKKNGKITGTVMVKTGFNQAVMCQPTITIRNSIR